MHPFISRQRRNTYLFASFKTDSILQIFTYLLPNLHAELFVSWSWLPLWWVGGEQSWVSHAPDADEDRFVRVPQHSQYILAWDVHRRSLCAGRVHVRPGARGTVPDAMLCWTCHSHEVQTHGFIYHHHRHHHHHLCHLPDATYTVVCNRPVFFHQSLQVWLGPPKCP